MTTHQPGCRPRPVRLHLVTASLVLMFSLVEPAWAYLDPGTGWMILQGLLATLAAAGVAIGTFWTRVKGWFSPHKRVEDGDKSEPSSPEKS